MANDEQPKIINQLSDRELQEWIYKFSLKSERHLNTIKNILLAYIIIGLAGGIFLAIVSMLSPLVNRTFLNSISKQNPVPFPQPASRRGEVEPGGLRPMPGPGKERFPTLLFPALSRRCYC
jgi:hypothetical protein